ncbi:MAG: endonuclease V [Methanosarcinaceae archaeon]|nr:endonuclease V [Methanosarcinaceae archaeon]
MDNRCLDEWFDPVSHSIDYLIGIQSQIASKVVVEDDYGPLTTIAGADCAFFDDSIICGIVVLDYMTLNVIERIHVIRKVRFPYISTFLSFREGGAIAAALAELESLPDMLMFDGCGINHPRRVGLASHVGAVLDIPTIGVAKNILCGNAHVPESVGDAKPLFFKGEQIGWLVKPTGRSKPIVVAPGHRVSVKGSLEIVKHCLVSHKLPEPTRLAHLYVNKVKNELKSEIKSVTNGR